MENEIKVGEYCRTSAGKIFKCSEIVLGNIPEDENKTMIVQYIVKHSSNLIDLIQVGDMVHTRDVLNEDWYWMFDEEMVKATKETIEEGIDLVEVVTKEMMESISYKVERKD